MNNNAKIATKVKLMCGDVMLYFPSPRPGDIVYCSKCRDYFTVKKSSHHVQKTNVWWIDCKVCLYRRAHNDEKLAKTRARTHTLRSQHDIDIFSPDGRLVVTMSYTQDRYGNVTVDHEKPG